MGPSRDRVSTVFRSIFPHFPCMFVNQTLSLNSAPRAASQHVYNSQGFL